MTDNLVRAMGVIDKIKYLTVATVDTDGKPRNAPVFGIRDKQFNCYWGSYTDAQHSKNIEHNKNAYIVIYDSTVPPGTGFGVYIRALAAKVENVKEIDRIFELLKSKHDDHFWPSEAMSGKGPIRFYKAEAKQVRVNDGDKVSGIYVDIRKQLV